jgi:ubiquinone/menaquinone biosynthesis C-methylase UbiE
MPDRRADIVLSLAVLELLTAPGFQLEEILRVLRLRGRLLLATLSPRDKLLLEFLAFRLGAIVRAEIEDHKKYFDRQSLMPLFCQARFAADSLRIGKI